MDVHRKRMQVAVLSQDSKQLMNRNVPNDPGELAAILGPLGRGRPAVFEAPGVRVLKRTSRAR